MSKATQPLRQLGPLPPHLDVLLSPCAGYDQTLDGHAAVFTPETAESSRLVIFFLYGPTH